MGSRRLWKRRVGRGAGTAGALNSHTSPVAWRRGSHHATGLLQLRGSPATRLNLIQRLLRTIGESWAQDVTGSVASATFFTRCRMSQRQ